MSEELIVKIEKQIFRNDDDGFTIAQVSDDSGLFNILGYLPYCIEGSLLKVTGSFEISSYNGEPQFRFDTSEELLPMERDEIVEYLSSGAIKGIGLKTANDIVDYFGEDTMKILAETPDRLTEVKGIGSKRAKTMIKSFRNHFEFAKVAKDLHRYGLTYRQMLLLYKAYGTEAKARILENPYRLIDDLRGYGFLKADKIAQALEFDKEGNVRIQAAVTFVMEKAVRDGSTFLPKDILFDQVFELTEVSRELIEDAVINMGYEGVLVFDDVDGVEAIYLWPYLEAETDVAQKLKELEDEEPRTIMIDVDGTIAASQGISGIVLSEQQRAGVRTAVNEAVAVITGGPGTGKTTVINTLIHVFNEAGFSTALAAPTGRAAKRITETSGEEAKTIHRLLEYGIDEDTGWLTFKRNRDNRLDFDVVIIDEASMIDLMLMDALTDAIKPGTRLILVGDADQLPSVGAGNVLRDIIASGLVTVVHLKEIYRQAEESMIVVNAHRINRGDEPYFNVKSKDFFLLRKSSRKDIQATIVELVTHRLPSFYSVDPLRDIQVLTPSRKGELGTEGLNNSLQETLNPKKPGITEKIISGKKFRTFDKVMQIRNNYEMKWRSLSDGSKGEGVFNGDVGYIQRIDNEEEVISVLFDDDRVAVYDFGDADDLVLAYAVTVHKSQGSEFPVVVMPASWVPPVLGTRNLLYTAVTRAKKLMVMVGSEDIVKGMVRNNLIEERYSGLKYRLSQIRKLKSFIESGKEQL